jgi:hypothetical protein
MDWYSFLGIALLTLPAFWAALRAMMRRRPWLALAKLVVGYLVIIELPTRLQLAWEASHPDQEWSMNAPQWLYFTCNPFVFAIAFLLFSWLVDRTMGWGKPHHTTKAHEQLPRELT